ncbi:hypothetical protein LPTSP4_24770 [Leptospira ryugenii]|uniref:PET hydrolase/cutinase-like domain-containing protein n=1 Tax=Leptospira ryugenii TaxID=1917863 RepID=A0A2P2E2A4_9LEPT|nr:hypothetical protein [Leptospira ryugenii]GBF50946.1 hypothetical protein LPTSP4_24770 [Leptospira ryugenii]
MSRQLVSVFSLIIISFFVQCKEKEEKSFNDVLLESIGLSFASSTGRCAINSSNNASYFSKGTSPAGSLVVVDRIDARLPTAGSVEIYYPKTGTGPFPIITLFPGGNVHGSFYSRYAARIAADGYVVWIPSQCVPFFTQYFLKPSSAAGNEVLAYAKQLQTDSTSALFGKLNTDSMAYLGHSLGGVTAIYALNGICQVPFCDPGTSFLSEVKVALVYGAGLTNTLDPNQIRLNSAGKATPLVFLQGALDTAFPPQNALSSYENYKSIKYLANIDGMNHYGITDVNNPFGANAERTQSTLSQEESITRLANLSILFLNAYLKSNTADLTKVNGNTTGITGVTISNSL